MEPPLPPQFVALPDEEDPDTAEFLRRTGPTSPVQLREVKFRVQQISDVVTVPVDGGDGMVFGVMQGRPIAVAADQVADSEREARNGLIRALLTSGRRLSEFLPLLGQQAIASVLKAPRAVGGGSAASGLERPREPTGDSPERKKQNTGARVDRTADRLKMHPSQVGLGDVACRSTARGGCCFA